MVEDAYVDEKAIRVLRALSNRFPKLNLSLRVDFNNAVSFWIIHTPDNLLQQWTWYFAFFRWPVLDEDIQRWVEILTKRIEKEFPP